MGPLIRAASLRGFVPLVGELGGEPQGLLARFGINPVTLASDDGLISITAHDRMLDAAATELERPDFGLLLAERQDLTILGPLAVAIESSPTLAEALRCSSRFIFVHSPALQIGVVPDPRSARGVVALSYRKDLLMSPYSPQAMELGLGLFHRVAVALAGDGRGIRSVEIPHSPQSPVQRYLDFFGCDVQFNATIGALRVERAVLDRRFDGADATISRLALAHLAREHPDLNVAAAAQVRRTMAELLATGVPGLPQVARLLTLHPRTLQRRLSGEGVSFDELLDGVRRDAAHRYITTTGLPLGQVANLVGFTEQSSLSHAVRRWFAMSPRELRRVGATVAEDGR